MERRTKPHGAREAGRGRRLLTSTPLLPPTRGIMQRITTQAANGLLYKLL